MDADHHRVSTKCPVILGTGNLTIDDVIDVARYGRHVSEFNGKSGDKESDDAYNRAQMSRSWIERAVNQGEPLAYYGINTGFGAKAGRKPLPKEDIPWVSRNLIVSHSTGIGQFLHPEVVRAAMLIRANSLAQGYSGVSLELINTLVQMLNAGICPAVPEYGSVGASGDLAPLSHLGLVLSKRPTNRGERPYISQLYDEGGLAYIEKRGGDTDLQTVLVTNTNGYRVEYALLNGHEAMRRRGIEPLELGPKEGLALNNGATFSAAIAALALHDAENIARHSEIAAALSLEALLGFRDAFFPHIQRVRRHKGQIEVADRIMKMVKDSTLVDGDVNKRPQYVPPQDAYSIRVTPQVVGAVWDTLRFIRQVITDEINAATDNPLVFDLPEDHQLHLPREYRVVSGGNFHGAPIAYVMDFLSIVLTDLGSLCERRIFRLMDPNLSYGLPLMLIEEKRSGQTSGMMIVQYLAACLVADCKTLSCPDSVDSIPTSANQEDHVSMSMNAARHARQVVENIEYVVAIELLCAALGLDWRINDLRMKKEKMGGESEGPKSKEEERSREDEKVLFLLQNDLEPRLGEGTQVAFELIQQWLKELPKLGGKEVMEEDRYLRPYVLRMVELLRSGRLVEEVYKRCGIRNGHES